MRAVPMTTSGFISIGSRISRRKRKRPSSTCRKGCPSSMKPGAGSKESLRN